MFKPDIDIIVDSLHEFVVYFGPDMAVQWANRTACESLGFNLEDMVGKRCHDLWYGKQEHCPGCPVLTAIESGQYESGETRTPDGRTWLVQATPVCSVDGNLEGVVEVALDISHHKEAEEKLARAKAMDDLMNAMLDPVVVFTTNGKTVYANRAFCEMFQLEQREFIGRNFTMIPGFQNQRADEIMRYTPLFREVIMEGRSGPIELPIVRRDGSEVHVSGTAGALRDKKNKISHVVVVLHDISRRKIAERSLKSRQQTLEDTLSATALVDERGQITWADQAFLLLWELESEADVRNVAIASFWQDRDLVAAAVQAAHDSGRWEGEMVGRNKDGKNFRAQVLILTCSNVAGTIWDVSTLNST